MSYRFAPALLALGLLSLGALTGCAPAPSGAASAQVLPDQSLSPFTARADAATLVFKSQTSRAGAVDVTLNNVTVLRQVRSGGPYRVVTLPPGRQTLSVSNTLSGTLLEQITVDLQVGEVYALALDVDPTTREYVLRLGRGSDAVSDLISTY